MLGNILVTFALTFTSFNSHENPQNHVMVLILQMRSLRAENQVACSLLTVRGTVESQDPKPSASYRYFFKNKLKGQF